MLKTIGIIFLACIQVLSVSAIRRMPLPEKAMVVIIPSYNNARWYKQNLESIFNQRYENYRVIYIDDCSKDGTADLVEAYVKEMGQEHRFELICNKERRGALANLYYAIHSCDDDAIVVTVDGDDWLAHQYVLRHLNNAYSTKDIWLTHGRLQETEGGYKNWCMPVPRKAIRNNEFRKYRCPSHLRTFYAWLFKQIRTEDLMYKGEFFPMTWDQAMMFPMLEMAGERHLFMKEILYIYNTTTNINDNKVNPQLQRDLEAVIRAMPPYERIEKHVDEVGVFCEI